MFLFEVSFVLYMKYLFINDNNEVYVEFVFGLGEILVLGVV